MTDFTLEDTFHLRFSTRDAAGASTVLAGTPVVSAYEDGSVTQITAGITLGVDHDSVVGLNLLTIVATAANGYEAGKSYDLVITTGTVDGVTVTGSVVASFTLERSAAKQDTATLVLATIITSGTMQAGSTSTTAVLASATSFADDTLIGATLYIISGTGAGQSNLISDWVSSTDTATVGRAWAVTPDNTSVYVVLPFGGVTLTGAEVGAAPWDALRASHVDAGSFGENVLADAIKISGDATAADNLEAQFDLTGLSGDTFPSTQSQLDGIANVGSAVHRPASSYTLTTGTQSANTYTSTEALDGTRHEHTDDAGAMALEYHFLIGAGTPSSIQISGYVTGSNDDIDVFGYDWVTAGYKQIGNIPGSSSTSNSVYSFDVFVDMVGSGADLGKVDIKLSKASGLSSATLAVDQIFVAYSQGAEGYQNAAVWFDSSASNTNTVVGVDGTPRNPVSTEAAVNTLLASTNLKRVEVAVDSSITFATSHTAEVWTGDHWILALGGQDLSDAHFVGAEVAGIGTGTSPIDFKSCDIGTCTLHQFHADGCGLSGTITFGEAGSYVIANTHSRIAGATTPILDTGAAIGNVDLAMPDYDNGIEIRNLNATGADTFSISGQGQIIYAASCSGTVEQRGNWKVTNTGGVTINYDAVSSFVSDTFAEPSAPPAATSSMEEKISWAAAVARNKITQTATTQIVKNDGDSGAIGTAPVSDDGTTAIRGKFV